MRGRRPSGNDPGGKSPNTVEEFFEEKKRYQIFKLLDN